MLLATFPSGAQEIHYLMRSPRGLLMGDAYGSLAEDQFTLFYNPALMGRHQGFSGNFLNFNVEATNALDEVDRFDDFPDNDPVAITNRLLGFPVYLSLGTAPGLKMGYFAMSLFAASKVSLTLENAIHPTLDVNYAYDKGVALGFGVPVAGRISRRRVKYTDDITFGRGMITSVGVGAKYINRSGLDRKFPVFSTTLLNEINNSNNVDFNTAKSSLGYSKGDAWSFDLGVDQVIAMGSSELSVGLSWQNVLDTKFDREEGEFDLPVLKQKIGLNSAFRQDFGFLGYALSLDLRPIERDIDFARKIHLGLLIDLPIVNFMAGYNEGYISYGVELDVWMFKLTAGFYGVEVGRTFKEKEGKRAVLNLELLDISFDG